MQKSSTDLLNFLQESAGSRLRGGYSMYLLILGSIGILLSYFWFYALSITPNSSIPLILGVMAIAKVHHYNASLKCQKLRHVLHEY